MIRPIIVVVNGHPRSGKDTFCTFAEEKYETINYSTVDTVKTIAVTMGWDGVKTDENRNMLSELKDFTTKWFDMTFEEMTYLINYECEQNSLQGDLVQLIFLHIREPKEISRIMSWCNDNSYENYSLCISRNSVEGGEFSNHADKNINNIIYDTYLCNNGTIEEFKLTSISYCDNILHGRMRND